VACAYEAVVVKESDQLYRMWYRAARRLDQSPAGRASECSAMPNEPTVGPGSRFRTWSTRLGASGGAAGQFRFGRAGHAGRVPRWDTWTMYYRPSIPTGCSSPACPAPRRLRWLAVLRQKMKAAVLYRVASVLLVFFASDIHLVFASPSQLELTRCLARCGQFTLTCGLHSDIGDLLCCSRLLVACFIYLPRIVVAARWTFRRTLALMRGTAWAPRPLLVASRCGWRYLFILPIVFRS